jgi:subtilisin family serine protease
MKNMKTLGISLVLLFSSTAFCAEEMKSYTLQLAPPAASLAQVQAAFPKLKIRPLFSEAEKANLRRFKRAALAETQLLGPITAYDAIDFEEKFGARFPNLKLERNDSIQFSSTDPVQPDPLAGSQWALKNTGQEVRIDLDDLRTIPMDVKVGEDIRLPAEKDLANLKPVVVAVLDTGLDITHPDLKNQLRWKKPECEALTTYLTCMNDAATADPVVPTADAEKACLAKVGDLDRDKNGYPMDCVGWSVTSSLSLDEKSPLSRVLGSPDMDDALGHGTHVAGIIAAEKNNGVGVSGLAQNVSILPVRVIDTTPTSPLRPQSVGPRQASGDIPDPSEDKLKMGKSSVELIARGMLYAITEKVQVMNLSLGWPATINSSVIADMIKLARENGIAVIAAAGNDATDALVLPCSFPGVICVGSYGPDGKRADYSNRGPGVDLLAPGTSMLSTYPLALRARFFTDLQGYEFMSGTSMSAPMVSGAMAILLGKGYSVDESLARMISSARVEGDPVGENLRLDLAKSLTVTPRPLVRVTERAPVRLVWRNRDEVLNGTIHVKNLWKNMATCSVRYRLVPAQDTVSKDTLLKNLTVNSSLINCSSWKSDEEKTLPFQLKVLGARASRDFILDSDFTYTSESGAQFKQTLQTAVRIAPTVELISNVLAFQSMPIIGKQFGNGTMVRTLVAADAKSTYAKPEYVILSRLQDGIAFQILSNRKSANSYEYSAPQKITDLSWNFLVGQRYYSQEAKANRIALLFSKKSEISGLTQIRFDIYDDNLEKQVRTFTYDGSFAPLPENFRWTTLNGKDAVLFIANGKEASTGDEWHQVLDLTILLRCYVLDSEGALSTIVVDQNDPQARIVDLLPYRPEDTEKGENGLLIIRGKDYRLNYFIGHFNEGKVLSMQPFEIKPYRNMGFLTSTPLLNEDGPATGNTLSSGVGRGKMRSTVLFRSGYNTITNGDFRFSPLSSMDGISRIFGGFNLSDKNAFFAQTNSDLQYHEFTASGETVVKTSLNRFSFLPITVSQRAFFPILVKNEANQTEPSVLSADIGSGFFNLSALIPERDASGKVIGILRPALMTFEENESGCSFIINPVWDREQKVYRMNSFCGDTIRSVVLQLPH